MPCGAQKRRMAGVQRDSAVCGGWKESSPNGGTQPVLMFSDFPSNFSHPAPRLRFWWERGGNNGFRSFFTDSVNFARPGVFSHFLLKSLASWDFGGELPEMLDFAVSGSFMAIM